MECVMFAKSNCFFTISMRRNFDNKQMKFRTTIHSYGREVGLAKPSGEGGGGGVQL